MVLSLGITTRVLRLRGACELGLACSIGDSEEADRPGGGRSPLRETSTCDADASEPDVAKPGPAEPAL